MPRRGFLMSLINIVVTSSVPAYDGAEYLCDEPSIYLPISGESISKLCEIAKKVTKNPKPVTVYTEVDNFGKLMREPSGFNPYYSGQEETKDLVFPLKGERETFFISFEVPGADYNEDYDGISFGDLVLEDFFNSEKSRVAIQGDGFFISLMDVKDHLMESYIIPLQFLFTADKVMNGKIKLTEIPYLMNIEEYVPFREQLEARLKGE